ncbi:MAG: DUF1501 domain-containing protein [Phycisphaera sp.]|nr:DUF1501 domain-containing protein [Phycisphaera sp.]
MASHKFCDGIKRRDFIAFGAATGFGLGLNLPGYLQRAAAGQIDEKNARGRAGIFIRLAGGPTHMDTFDLKPDAPDTHRGEFNPIKTNVPGIEICEHMPRLAQCADKFAILRGVSHSLGAHGLGSEYLNTGNRPIPSLEFPTYGSVVAREMVAPRDIPPFVAIPNFGQGSGYMSVEYGPFSTGASPKPGQRMDIRGLALTNGVKLEDIDRRQNLLNKFDNAFGKVEEEDKLLQGLDKFSQRTYEMLRSERTRTAFDLSKESASITSMFTQDDFAQSCLLATRLVEAGVRFVTIQIGGWDTHQDNFNKLKDTNLPKLDGGLAGLFNALHAKGLLDSTSVMVSGEFGRTPKINQRGGRDHYPRAMFCLLAGGGMKGGQVIGASNDLGTGPADDVGISPDNVAASFYHSLGIDHTKEYNTPSGRPVMIVRYGKVIKELFA